MKIIIVALLALTFAGCASRHQAAARADDRRTIETELGQEMSLKADRDSLGELRQEIPEETKKANDELALFLNFMNQGNENPQMVRDRFNMMVQKKRASFRDKVTKLRENYRNEETGRREKQFNSAKAKRDSFLRRKHDAKASREFFNDQEKARLAFLADERARRSSFESEITAKSKDFDSYMRERQKEFDEQYRLYSKKYSERRKDKNAATGDEFRRLEQAPSTSLGTEN